MKALTNTLMGAVIGGSVLLGGCASIVSKSDYPIAVNSTPDQAQFVIRNRAGEEIARGVTPTMITLKSGAGYFKGEAYTLTFKKDGYADHESTLQSQLNEWYWGNLLFGGLIGMLIVDPATGAMWKLPPTISASLSPKAAAAEGETQLQVVTIDQIPAHQRDFLIRIN
jgi:hypothetical protein